MKFWRLEYPSYETGDYGFTAANGGGNHPWGLPGIDCPKCTPWGGSRVLPYVLPESLRKDPFLNEAWPIDPEDHNQLRARVRHELLKRYSGVPELMPGDSFCPGVVSFPSIPTYDFLWPMLGSPVVKARVREVFEREGVTGVEWAEVTIAKVGDLNPSEPVPEPSTGEPEDIISESLPLANPAQYGPLFEMVVVSESGPPPGYIPRIPCSICGRAVPDEDTREFHLTPQIVPNTDIFMFQTTLHIVVSDRVRRLIRKNEFTNVAFEKFLYYDHRR